MIHSWGLFPSDFLLLDFLFSYRYSDSFINLFYCSLLCFLKAVIWNCVLIIAPYRGLVKPTSCSLYVCNNSDSSPIQMYKINEPSLLVTLGTTPSEHIAHELFCMCVISSFPIIPVRPVSKAVQGHGTFGVTF